MDVSHNQFGYCDLMFSNFSSWHLLEFWYYLTVAIFFHVTCQVVLAYPVGWGCRIR